MGPTPDQSTGATKCRKRFARQLPSADLYIYINTDKWQWPLNVETRGSIGSLRTTLFGTAVSIGPHRGALRCGLCQSREAQAACRMHFRWAVGGTGFTIPPRTRWWMCQNSNQNQSNQQFFAIHAEAVGLARKHSYQWELATLGAHRPAIRPWPLAVWLTVVLTSNSTHPPRRNYRLAADVGAVKATPRGFGTRPASQPRLRRHAPCLPHPQAHNGSSLFVCSPQGDFAGDSGDGSPRPAEPGGS